MQRRRVEWNRDYLWLFVLAGAILNVYLSCMAWEDVRGQIGWVKNIPQETNFKLRHIVQYAPQAFLTSLAIDKSFLTTYKNAFFFGVLIILCQGILTETIQFFVPSRIPAPMDVFWDVLAGIIGSGLYLFFRVRNPR